MKKLIISLIILLFASWCQAADITANGVTNFAGKMGLTSADYEAETTAYLALPGVSLTATQASLLNQNIRAIKYGSGITLSSVTAGLSTVNGTAFVTNPSVDLRPYTNGTGWKFVFTDTANKTATIYANRVGTGETYLDIIGGTNPALLNGDFSLGDDGTWTKDAGWSITTVATGQGVTGYNAFRQSYSPINGALFKGSLTIATKTGGLGLFFNLPSGTMFTASTAGTFSGYRTCGSTGNAFSIGGNSTFSGTVSLVTFQRVLTPGPTGFFGTSTSGGSTYNWTNIDSGFNPNTIQIITITRS